MRASASRSRSMASRGGGRGWRWIRPSGLTGSRGPTGGIRGGSSRSLQCLQPAELAGAREARVSQALQDPHDLQPLRSLSLSPCALPAKPPSLLAR